MRRSIRIRGIVYLSSIYLDQLRPIISLACNQTASLCVFKSVGARMGMDGNWHMRFELHGLVRIDSKMALLGDFLDRQSNIT